MDAAPGSESVSESKVGNVFAHDHILLPEYLEMKRCAETRCDYKKHSCRVSKDTSDAEIVKQLCRKTVRRATDRRALSKDR